MFEELEDAVRPVVKIGSDWPKVNEIANKILKVENNGIKFGIKTFGLNS